MNVMFTQGGHHSSFFAMGCSDNPIGMDQDRSAIMNLDFAFPRLSTFLDRDGDHVRLGMCLCGLSVYYSVRSGGGTLGHLINLGPVTALILHIATARLLEMFEHINCA